MGLFGFQGHSAERAEQLEVSFLLSDGSIGLRLAQTNDFIVVNIRLESVIPLQVIYASVCSGLVPPSDRGTHHLKQSSYIARGHNHHPSPSGPSSPTCHLSPSLLPLTYSPGAMK